MGDETQYQLTGDKGAKPFSEQTAPYFSLLSWGVTWLVTNFWKRSDTALRLLALTALRQVISSPVALRKSPRGELTRNCLTLREEERREAPPQPASRLAELERLGDKRSAGARGRHCWAPDNCRLPGTPTVDRCAVPAANAHFPNSTTLTGEGLRGQGDERSGDCAQVEKCLGAPAPARVAHGSVIPPC